MYPRIRIAMVSKLKSMSRPSTSTFSTGIGIILVPEQQAWVVERFGCYHRVVKPGVNLILPWIESVNYKYSLKVKTLDLPIQHVVTADNAALVLESAVDMRITDPQKASYGVENIEFSISRSAQNSIVSEFLKIDSSICINSQLLNRKILKGMNESISKWGVECVDFMIRSFKFDEETIKLKNYRRQIIQCELVKNALKEANLWRFYTRRRSSAKAQWKVLPFSTEVENIINIGNRAAHPVPTQKTYDVDA